MIRGVGVPGGFRKRIETKITVMHDKTVIRIAACAAAFQDWEKRADVLI